MTQDLYSILGIEKTDDQELIKKAYRSKAKKVHPDINPSQEALISFQELSKAYSILSDVDLKKRYDAGIPIEENQPQYYEQFTQADWMDDFKFGSRNYYPPIDFKANVKRSRTFCYASLFICLSFLIDLLIFFPIGNDTIISKKTEIERISSQYAINWVYLTTPNHELKIRYDENSPSVGDSISIKRSLLYGNLKFKKHEANRGYTKSERWPVILYVFAFISLLVASIGISKKLNYEQTFNTAIVSGFFTLVTIALGLIS